MKVLLIDPFEYQAVYGRVRYPPGAPSLGLGYLASYLMEKGIEVHILDARGKALSVKEIGDFAIEYGPSLIGITSTTPVFGNAVQIARHLKELLPGVPIVLGGPHITGQGAEILKKWPFVDTLVRGEGEETLLELAEEKEFSAIAGVVYREDGETVANRPRPLIADLDRLPFPERRFYDLRDYRHPLHEIYGKPLTTLISGRGCPFRCSFCNSQATFGRRVRHRSVANVMEEVDFLIRRYRVKSLKFSDDTFALTEKRIEEICPELAKRNIAWICNARVNTVTRRMIRLMKDSGCRLLQFGLESGDPLILRELQKDIKIEQMRQALAWTCEAGIDSTATFIFGAPSETAETVRATMRLVKELSPTFVNFFILSPYPGTRIYEEMKAKGYMKEFEWTDVHAPKYGNPLIIHPNIAEEDLIRFQKEAYFRYYLRPSYLVKLLKSIDSLTKLKGYIRLGMNFIRMVG